MYFIFGMDGTPKLNRKSSLSLSTRLNQKRHSASPQNCFKISNSNGVNAIIEINMNSEIVQRSPSGISLCSDAGIECTPPHKKIAVCLDESVDFSPKLFDTSFSPTCLLSQTLVIDSPEVGWKWNRHSAIDSDSKCIGDNSVHTPDSAYAPDCSFVSAGSSTTEVIGSAHIRGNSCKQRSANDARREGKKKILERELRRVENTRAEQKLKERCAKLEEQLKSAGSQAIVKRSQQKELSCKTNEIIISDSSSKDLKTSKCPTPEKPRKTELLSDFFNDSDSDCLLLAVTQEIESKIEAKTQPEFKNFATNTSKTTPECSSEKPANSAPAATTTPLSNKRTTSIENESINGENKGKRSSFYMKFLEDDCLDDWFVSLDEAILQATQSKQARTSLQRYKSMPEETAATSNTICNKTDNNNRVMSTTTNSSEGTVLPSTSSLSRMKRHSSTHSLSPTVSHYRSRRQL